MNFVDLIIKKRDGGKLSKEALEFFIKGVTDGSLPDYQVSSFLMAVIFQGLDEEETAYLTMAMVNSGATFDLSAVSGFKVDKHSTGGVADTTTLVLAPLVASIGVPVVKMSGRGLGFSGGTIDKLESIPGFQTNVTKEKAIAFAQQSNIVVMGQTDDLVPADKKLYALRDVTGTVESIPLIAASIMSKKIAAGADGIVLDVKCGSGAFMKDLASAQKLAHTMVAMGKQVGRKVTALISSMEQPLGQYIGNRLEVIEAIEVLKGNTKGDLLTVCLALGAQMLLMAGHCSTQEEANSLLLEHIENGKGLAKLKELIVQQGGNPAVIDNTELLCLSPCKLCVKASEDGYISRMDTAQIGRASLETGAGRAYKDQPIDFGAGIIMKKRIGDMVAKEEPIAEVFSNTMERCENAASFLQEAICIQKEIPEIPQLILDYIQ